MSEARDDQMIYEARADKNRGIALFQLVVGGLVTVPVLVTLVLSLLGLGLFSYVGGIASGALCFYLWRRSESPSAIVLRVAKRKLFVDDGSRSFEIPLRDLENVTLEKREVKKVRDGAPILPALMTINSTVDSATEIVRVALEGEGRSFTLTEEWQPYSAGLEGMGKVRVFLRKHGWVPPSERWGELPAEEAPAPKAKRKKKAR